MALTHHNTSKTSYKVPRLVRNRQGTYYIRFKLPKALQALIGQVEFRKSLGTKSYSIAKVLALYYNTLYEICKMDKPKVTDFLISLQNNNSKYEIRPDGTVITNGTNEDHSMAMEALEKIHNIGQFKQSFEPVVSKLETQSKLFVEVFKLYLQEKKLTNKQSTLGEKQYAFSEFNKLFSSPRIGKIGFEEALTYKNRLLGENLSGNRINTKLSYFVDFFNWSINNKYYFQQNPFNGLRIADAKKNVEHYEAFIDDELKLIFNQKHYDYMALSPDYYFGPLISLFTGARIEEICSLPVSNIKQESGIYYFDIVKAVAKNENSIRKIPIPQIILDMGFLEYVAQVKALNEEYVFFYLKDGKNGFSKNLSRRFGYYLDRKYINLISATKVFHSFRGTFITYLTDLNINPALVMSIVGHIEQELINVNLNSDHFKTYQGEKSLARLKEIVDLVKFDFIKPSMFMYHSKLFDFDKLKHRAEKEKNNPPKPQKYKL